jgi:hypothetical protein
MEIVKSFKSYNQELWIMARQAEHLTERSGGQRPGGKRGICAQAYYELTGSILKSLTDGPST